MSTDNARVSENNQLLSLATDNILHNCTETLFQSETKPALHCNPTGTPALSQGN